MTRTQGLLVTSNWDMKRSRIESPGRWWFSKIFEILFLQRGVALTQPCCQNGLVENIFYVHHNLWKNNPI